MARLASRALNVFGRLAASDALIPSVQTYMASSMRLQTSAFFSASQALWIDFFLYLIDFIGLALARADLCAFAAAAPPGASECMIYNLMAR